MAALAVALAAPRGSSSRERAHVGPSIAGHSVAGRTGLTGAASLELEPAAPGLRVVLRGGHSPPRRRGLERAVHHPLCQTADQARPAGQHAPAGTAAQPYGVAVHPALVAELLEHLGQLGLDLV